MDNATTLSPTLCFDRTDEIEAITTEISLLAQTEQIRAFDEPAPLPEALEGEPAYLLEVRAPRRAPSLYAVRTTLVEACLVAESIHPSVADVVIREVRLPCDAESLVRLMAEMRAWSRDPDGAWVPPLPGT
jgi:hypothetical protein